MEDDLGSEHEVGGRSREHKLLLVDHQDGRVIVEGACYYYLFLVNSAGVGVCGLKVWGGRVQLENVL